MTVWKRTMDYLGLGPDDAYDSYDDGAADERAPRAARNDAGRRPRGYGDDGVGEPRGPAPRPAYPSPDGRGRPGIAGDPTVNVHSPERLAPAHDPMSRPPSPGGSSEPHAVRPRRFDEAQEVADKFKEGLPVIMNLESAERDVARRLIDFASGLCYGLDGTMEKVATGVYLLKPPAVRPRVDGYGYD